MILGFHFRKAQIPRDLFYAKSRLLREKLQELNSSFVESARLWAKALKLLLKVCHFFFEVRRLRFRYLKLTSENCNIVSKYSDLLLLKINYIFFDSGISERIYDAARDLLPVHTETVDQNHNGDGNPIIRQVCNRIVYVDSWQTVTLTKRLSIKSSTLPTPSQSKAMIFWNRQTLNA